MMKWRYVLLSILLGTACYSFAQKPVLDINKIGYDKWPQVQGPAISNDGRYVLYTMYNVPAGSNTTCIQAGNGNWKTDLPGVGVGQAHFSPDSRQVVFMQGKDSLCLLTLGTPKREVIPGVLYFRILDQGHQSILAIQKNNGELVLRKLNTGKELTYAGVKVFTISENGKVLLLLKTLKSENGTLQSADRLVLASGKISTIWQGSGNAGPFIFDSAGQQIAFMLSEKEGNSIWYYREGMDKAELLADGNTAGIDAGLRLQGIQNFSKDGSRIFVKLKEPDFPKARPEAAKVDVWSYTDPTLQSRQLAEVSPQPPFFEGGPRSFVSVIGVKDHRLIRLEREDETIDFLNHEGTDTYAVLRHAAGIFEESHWSSAARPAYTLISTKTGERRVTHPEGTPLEFNISPEGQYLLYQGPQGIDLFSYEITSGITRNLTRSLSIPIGDFQEYDSPGTSYFKSRGLFFAAWLGHSSSVLFYDNYDIWQLDLSGKAAPINVTGGYGRKHHIIFRAINAPNIIAQNASLLLSAFNNDNKDNGFYHFTLGQKKEPELLTMGPFVYCAPAMVHVSGFTPIRAHDADTYIVQRQSAGESRNFFLTKDFKTYTPVSDVYPERDYNWMSSELVNFETRDGKHDQGVLYKPEDFDPNKKYPVIIQYYERKSELLNFYHLPETASDDIDIPWFVSHGYLVFTPDIHYSIGENGASALNTVTGVYNYLKTLPYVDAKKVGIQGHSFGGFETDYIVTHTSLFAAALSSAGMSDETSNYNDLWGTGDSKQYYFEEGQGRMGATLWQRPDLYLKNSPILLADKVSTPLLMRHSKEDGAVAFSQGMELFTALRRLGKRAWLLQYDHEGHNLFNISNRIDYTTRMMQFFDHYLKGAPAPEWMLHGIPAKMKGVDDGLKLDTTGATPGPGLATDHPESATE